MRAVHVLNLHTQRGVGTSRRPLGEGRGVVSLLPQLPVAPGGVVFNLIKIVTKKKKKSFSQDRKNLNLFS